MRGQKGPRKSQQNGLNKLIKKKSRKKYNEQGWASFFSVFSLSRSTPLDVANH